MCWGVPSMWTTWWFNLLLIAAYTAVAFVISAMITPDETGALVVIGLALAYGFGNVHFVLWFTFYTRRNKDAQYGKGADSVDELSL
jgi:hypothetical protein